MVDATIINNTYTKSSNGKLENAFGGIEVNELFANESSVIVAISADAIVPAPAAVVYVILTLAGSHNNDVIPLLDRSRPYTVKNCKTHNFIRRPMDAV